MALNNNNETNFSSAAEKTTKMAATSDFSEPKMEYDYFPGKIDPYVIVILSQL